MAAAAEFMRAVARLVAAGFPRETAEKIVRGDLPMDAVTKAARMQEQGFTTPAYSGSTFDIRAFDTSRSNPEGDWGRATYATTSPRDATANYAGVGPDLTARIQRQAERLADYADDEYSLGEMLDEVGLTLDDYYADEAGALEKVARAQLLGDAPGGVTYPLRINTQNYAVIGGDNPSVLTEARDYVQEAKQALGEAADEDNILEYADDLRFNDDQGLYARIREALAETDIYQDEQAINSVLEEIASDLAEGDVRIADIDAAIRRNVSEAYDEATGDLLSPGEISRQALQNLGFEGVIDNTVDLKFGTNRLGVLGRTKVPGMEGVTPETSHIITFPGAEKNIRSQFAAFDPEQTGSSNILAGLAPYAVPTVLGGSILGAAMIPEKAEAAPFGTLARAIGRGTLRAYTGSAAKYATPSIQRVGTGEGNQAFGYGLYFSDSPQIAGGYRRGVSGGKVLDRMSDRYFLDDLDLQSVDEMIDLGEFAAEDEKLMRALRDADYLGFDRPMDAVRTVFSPDINAFDPADPAVQKLQKIADEVGFLYEVEVPSENFIDWNLTLDEQPEVVQQVVRENVKDPKLREMIDAGSFRGSDAYYLFGNNPEVNSMMWTQYGVPGVRYNSFGRTIRGLDDARARKNAPQNYVIFDENLINVVRRNDEALENNFDEMAARAAATDVRKPLAAVLGVGAAATQAAPGEPGFDFREASARSLARPREYTNLDRELARLIQLAAIRRQPSITPLRDTAMARAGDYLLEDRPSEMDALQRALQRLQMGQGVGEWLQTTGQGDPTTMMQDLMAGVDIFDVATLLPGAGAAAAKAVRRAGQ